MKEADIDYAARQLAKIRSLEKALEQLKNPPTDMITKRETSVDIGIYQRGLSSSWPVWVARGEFREYLISELESELDHMKEHLETL